MRNSKSNATHSRVSKVLLSDDSPFGYKESYKTLRTNISFGLHGEHNKVLLVSSTLPREGKSVVCANLAISLAQNGAKVLLVDCDLRKPSIQNVLGARKDHNRMGLSAVLIGQSEMEDVIFSHAAYGVDYILGGSLPPNPAELLGSEKMEQILNTARQKYDYVICDTPPVGTLTDAAVLSRFCDGVLLVTRQDYAQKDEVRAAVRKLQSVGANILGLIMSQYDVSKDSRRKTFPSQYYGYYGYE